MKGDRLSLERLLKCHGPGTAAFAAEIRDVDGNRRVRHRRSILLRLLSAAARRPSGGVRWMRRCRERKRARGLGVTDDFRNWLIRAPAEVTGLADSH
jgi:hypothetical protein